MLRLINLLTVLALLGCAAYAYNISYITLYDAERIHKAKADISRQHHEIAFLQAEWAHLVRPERLQALADRNLSLQPLALDQIVSADQLPNKTQQGDPLSAALSGLGLGDTTSSLAMKAHSTPLTPHDQHRPRRKPTKVTLAPPKTIADLLKMH
ncbi:MAG: hypothetical protein KGQ37_02690 [Hyphomicrobiales bacterium]|nr:hypothetical protein [Hyphomicrobiales bacterium]